MTVVKWILLALLAALVLLLLVPFTVRVSKHGEDTTAVLRWFGLRFVLYPGAEKEEKSTEKKQKKPKKPPKKKKTGQKSPQKLTSEQEEEKKRRKKEFLRLLLEKLPELLQAMGKALKRAAKRIILDHPCLWMKVGGPDAAQTAITYGKMSAEIYGIYAFLENILTIRRPYIQLTPDFLAASTTLEWECGVKTRLGDLLMIGIGLLGKALYLLVLQPAVRKQSPPESGGKSGGSHVMTKAGNHAGAGNAAAGESTGWIKNENKASATQKGRGETER